MKWQIDSHVKHENNVVLLEKKYFCILEEECTLGYATHTEVILKNNSSSNRCSDDNFVPPVNSQEPKNNDFGFIPPVNDDANTMPHNQIVSTNVGHDVQQVLLLFVKADSGNSIISDLKSEMKLSPRYSDELYLETMNLWVGTRKQFDEKMASDFSHVESKGDVPKLDFVIIQLQLHKDCQGYQQGASSIERINFFKHICNQELSIVRFSN